MKEVIFLAAKRSPKRDKLGQEIPHDYKGNFRRRVAPNTPGAFHYSGTIAATGKAYDYWATEADIIRGYLRWVDVQTDKFGTSIALYVESDKFLFKIALDYDVMNLRQVANYVSGMKKELDTYFFNITYDAWKDKDKDGNYKLMALLRRISTSFASVVRPNPLVCSSRPCPCLSRQTTFLE